MVPLGGALCEIRLKIEKEPRPDAHRHAALGRSVECAAREVLSHILHSQAIPEDCPFPLGPLQFYCQYQVSRDSVILVTLKTRNARD